MPEFAVIFDMDGVIVDSERTYQEIERQMYDHLGIPVSPEEHRLFIGAAERSMWTYMKKKYRIPVATEELVEEERSMFMSRLDQPGIIPLMPGLRELLEELAREGIPLCVASSSSRQIIEKVLRINDIRHFFAEITGGDEVTRSKPAPDIFLTTASKVGIAPGRCLVIEDSENGLKGARSAGMKVVALLNHDSGDLDLSQACRTVHDLHELDANVIRRLLP